MRMLNVGCGNHFHKDWVNLDFVSTDKSVIQHDLLNGIPFSDNSFEVVYNSHVLEHFTFSEGQMLLNECFRVLKKDGIIRIAVPDLEKIVLEYINQLTLASKESSLEISEEYEWIKLELFDQIGRNDYGGEIKKFISRPNLKSERYILQRVGNEFIKVRNKYLNKPVQKQKETIAKKIAKFILGKNLEYWEIGKFRGSGEIHQYMYDSYSLSIALKIIGFKYIQVCSFDESRIPSWNIFELDSKNGQALKPDSLYIEAIK